MSKIWPVVVIVESRTVAEAADVMYTTAQEELNRYEITVSRISVAHMLDIPTAIRLGIEGMQNKGRWRTPLAFIASGADVKNPISLIHYQEVTRSLLELAREHRQIIANALCLHADDALAQSQTFQDYHQSIFDGIRSVISLVDLKHKLHMEPGHKQDHR